MAPKNLPHSSLLLLLLLPCLFLEFSSAADAPPSTPTPPSTICKSTPYPSECNSVLPSNTSSSSNVYDYGRVSFRKSLTAARKFLALIQKVIRKSRGTLTVTAIRALQDCEFLAQSNIDDILSFIQILNRTSQTLPIDQADRIQSLLSAVLTNTQTCIDGLQVTASTWSVRNGIILPLSNDTRLYSVSLALFTKGWVPKKRRGTPRSVSGRGKRLRLRNGKLNLKMSDRTQAIYRTFSNNRRLLQASDGSDQVQVSDIVVVSQDGTGNYTTINDAVGAAPNNTDGTNGYFMIYVTAGVYQEYIAIPKNKKYLLMMGDGINQTIITGNHNYIDGWTTFNSPTFSVVATGFVAVNITFQNTAGPSKHQAVAVRNGADLSTFYSCSFEGYQDTLYVHSLRQFYVECDIYGTIDFIFGNAAVVFQDCNIYPRLPMPNQFNTITAQGRTDPNQNTGISIQNCTIRAADDLANNGGGVPIQTYLGRPWKLYSRTVVMQTYIDSLLNPAGWSVWSGDFALNTSYYAEYANTGPGSDTSQRVTWPGFHIINATDAVNFTVSEFISGLQWVPQSGAPYTSSLY